MADWQLCQISFLNK